MVLLNSLRVCKARLPAGLFRLSPFCQSLIRQSASVRLCKGRCKPCPVRHFSCVESVRRGVEIAVKVERLNRMMSAVDRALEQTPEVFEAVRVDSPVDKRLCVVDHFMDVLAFQPIVRLQGIRVDGRASGHGIHNLRLKITLRGAPYRLSPNLTMPFEQAHDSGFADSASAKMLTLARVLEAFLSADEGFVNFHFAGQRSAVLRLHDGPDAVKHEPCRALCYFDGPRKLVRTEVLFRGKFEPEGREPFVEAKGRILKDSPYLDGELLTASLTAPEGHPARLASDCPDFFRAASVTRAEYTVRPANLGKELDTGFGVREVSDRFKQRLWNLVCHVHSLR